MEKVVLVFCKIENCYDGDEGYEKRKPDMPLFFEKLKKIKEISNADNIMFSFFTDKNYGTYYIKPTEININLKAEKSYIKLSNQFYKDESHVLNHHKSIEDCYEITKHTDSKTIESEILEYINKSFNDYDVKNIIFITDGELPVKCDYSDKIVTQAGFQNLISSLDSYIEEKNAKKYTYAKVV